MGSSGWPAAGQGGSCLLFVPRAASCGSGRACVRDFCSPDLDDERVGTPALLRCGVGSLKTQTLARIKSRFWQWKAFFFCVCVFVSFFMVFRAAFRCRVLTYE